MYNIFITLLYKKIHTPQITILSLPNTIIYNTTVVPEAVAYI